MLEDVLSSLYRAALHLTGQVSFSSDEFRQPNTAEQHWLAVVVDTPSRRTAGTPIIGNMEGKKEPLLALWVTNLGYEPLLVSLSLRLRITEFTEYLKLERTHKDHPSLPLSYNYFYFLHLKKRDKLRFYFALVTHAFLQLHCPVMI